MALQPMMALPTPHGERFISFVFCDERKKCIDVIYTWYVYSTENDLQIHVKMTTGLSL
jgi:hypothetical protein